MSETAGNGDCTPAAVLLQFPTVAGMQDANARLIADLYTALDELLAASLTETLLKESAGKRANARQMARAALKKARGET